MVTQKSIKRTILFNAIAAALVLASGTTAYADGDAGTHSHDAIDGAEIVATVNGKTVSALALKRVTEQLAAQGQQPNRAQIVDELVNLEILTQAAEELGLDKQDDVATALHLQYTQTMANAYLGSFSKDLTIGEDEIRAEYDKQIAAMKSSEYKASHILLDSEGHLCLADFGSALDLKDEQQEQLFLRGTALYACPELLRASKPCDITVACDHWSVGCILYAMSHGCSPFDHGSEALTVDAICSYADSGESESAWKQVEADVAKLRDEEDEEPTDQDLDEELKTLSRDLLAALPVDRISAWKEKAIPFLSLNDSEEGGDCPKHILLPVPEWKEEVENSTLRDGSLGWVAFQPL